MVVAERGVEFPDARGILTCLWPLSLSLSFFLIFIFGFGCLFSALQIFQKVYNTKSFFVSLYNHVWDELKKVSGPVCNPTSTWFFYKI